MGKTHSRSKSSKSKSHGRKQVVGNVSGALDYSKNLYYTKGNNVIAKRRNSNIKKVVGHFKREPGFLYYVKGNGDVMKSPMKHVR